MNQQHTEISQIGEFGLIRRIEKIVELRTDRAGTAANLIKGIADDAAVYRPSPGLVELLTTDALVEGVHFDLTFTSMRHLGWKAIVASLSDIAAMAGVPRYVTMTLCLPNKISVEMVEQLYEGAALACTEYSCFIVGGDTTATQGAMVISVTMIGEAEESRVVYRNGARPGDYVCVSGHLGSSVAGLKILLREKEQFLNTSDQQAFSPRFEPYTAALAKHLMPKPRLDLSRIFSRDVQVHSMIDVSDGLSSDLSHLCEESGTGALLFEDRIPFSPDLLRSANRLRKPPLDYALSGGEDYELLFTVPLTRMKALEALRIPVTEIGMITAGKTMLLVNEAGKKIPLRPTGYNHFTGIRNRAKRST